MQALEVNLCPLWYGVLAEIGAGQEVARWFFRVGGAAGEAVGPDSVMHDTAVRGQVMPQDRTHCPACVLVVQCEALGLPALLSNDTACTCFRA